MKNIRHLATLVMLLAVVLVGLKFAVQVSPLAGLVAAAAAFWLGANMMDTNWTPRARCCTNDISLGSIVDIIYAARDVVLRAGTRFIQGATINTGTEGISIGGTVNSVRGNAPEIVSSYTPAMTPPNASDITTSEDSMALDQVAGFRVPIKGEQFLQLDQANRTAGGAQRVIDTVIQRGIAGMVNQIESHVASKLLLASSRAVGTSGTTPFASNFDTIADLRRILFDNGVRVDDGQLSLVINSAAGANLRKLSSLYKANEAGSDATLRAGQLLNLHGFSIGESAGVASNTKGTGASYQLNGALAVGDTTVTVDTGTGTILAGNIVTIGNYKYIVKTALSAGSFTIYGPGIMEVVADDTAITVNNTYTGNIGFHRGAVELAMRPPAQPPGGDMGQHDVISDDVTGLVFQISLYKGYGMNMLIANCFYKAKVWVPEMVSTLQG